MKTSPQVQVEAALEIVRAWGRQGGKRRMSGLTRAERRALAKKAAAARWAKRKRPASP